MSSPEHKQLIWNLIEKIKIGMLVTREQDGSEEMRARPMSLVQDDYDGTLYFYTSKDAELSLEVENDRHVCLIFSDPENNVYVSLTGEASITEDKDLIDRYWSSTVAAWFEKGKEDPDLAMLKVKIQKGEHWDTKNNKLVQAFEMAKAKVLESTTPDLGENEKFGEN